MRVLQRRLAGTSPSGTTACLLLTAGIVAVDLAAGQEKTQYVGLLVAVPFLAATFTGPLGVLVLGGLAWLAGGFIGLVSDDGGSPAQYVRLACIAAAVAGAAIAARSRLRREAAFTAVQSAADAASRAILRPLPPVLAGVPIAVRYLSAFEASRVGGDLYEASDTPFGLRMVIGDVRGKGLDAVRLAALTLGSFREAAHREPDLRQVAVAMHAAVRRDAGPEDFVTALLVEVVGEDVQMLGCGHPGPLLIRGGKATGIHLPEHPPLGIACPAGPVPVELRPGDRVLLFTDGAAEARRDGRFFDLPSAAAAALGAGSLADGVELLSRQVHDYVGAGPGDDVAFLVFELPVHGSVVTA